MGSDTWNSSGAGMLEKGGGIRSVAFISSSQIGDTLHLHGVKLGARRLTGSPQAGLGAELRGATGLSIQGLGLRMQQIFVCKV